MGDWVRVAWRYQLHSFMRAWVQETMAGTTKAGAPRTRLGS